MYDFHKSRNSDNQECFRHSFFVRGQRNLLANIKRKQNFAVTSKSQAHP
jgi:hypothetical protein